MTNLKVRNSSNQVVVEPANFNAYRKVFISCEKQTVKKVKKTKKLTEDAAAPNRKQSGGGEEN